MAAPTLIYCADGNKRFAEIAIKSGFLYGAQLPAKHGLPFKPYFADQDWKAPNREHYMAALQKHRPTIATVLDLEKQEQLPTILSWAEEAAQYVGYVVVIPKVFGIIGQLPKKINNVEIILGYSVPTRYAGTAVPLWEFYDWPVHLLGGSPQKQMEIARYINVVSVDGNYHNKMATMLCAFWVNGFARYAQNRYWPQLQESDNKLWGQDAPYEAFKRSCENIVQAWQAL